MIKPEKLKFTGYRRPDGRFGIRNHVIILPVDDISNAAAEGVARLIKGTMALPHPYGRLQFGADFDLTMRTLAGIGRNPNSLVWRKTTCEKTNDLHHYRT